jgi:hypothetical protein
MPGEENLALAHPTEHEAALIQSSQPDCCFAALLRGWVKAERLLDLGCREQ